MLRARSSIDIQKTETVENLAALKALTSRPESVLVKTGQAAGVWQWVLASSTTADDVTVVTPTSGASGRYKRIFDGDSYPDWFGAIGDRSTASLNAVNAAIADVGAGSLALPHGDEYVVSSAPTNPNGVRFEGDGKILLPETGGFHQINTYADRDLLVGREYLYRAFRRISFLPSDPDTQLKVFVFGDSTIAGTAALPATIHSSFLVQSLLARLFNQQGIPNVSVTNRGVGSTSWTHLNAVPDLSSTTDLIIIKYGINEGVQSTGFTTVQERLNRLSGWMREKLAEIRAATYGALDECAILLVGPNATADTPNGRNEEWYEAVRNVYVQAARDYHCAFFDLYAYMRDARPAGQLWMDEIVAGGGRTIHPLDVANAWIWGKVVSTCFSREEIGYWSTNNFANYSLAGNAVTPSKLPNEYRNGMTWEMATTGNGFPATGILVTLRNPNSYSVQTLYPLSTTRRPFRRQAASGSAWDTVWAGERVALTLVNSWVAFGGSEVDPTACLSAAGLVTLAGIVKSGTTTIGTTITTLPAGYRPVRNHRFCCWSAGGVAIGINVGSSGAVTLLSTGDATWTALDSVAFMAT